MFRVSSVDELETVVADYRAHGIVDLAQVESVDDVSTLASRCS
jgi:hypothetical protein